MSDYKAKRLKKKNDLESALQSTRQDLYDWKQMSNRLQKISSNKQTHIKFPKSKTQLTSFGEHRFSSLDSSSGFTINHSSSAKDSKQLKTNVKMPLNSTRLRPLSSDSRNTIGIEKHSKLNSFSDMRVVDLESNESLLDEEKICSETTNSEYQKFYLRTSEKKSDALNQKTIEQILQELVHFFFSFK